MSDSLRCNRREDQVRRAAAARPATRLSAPRRGNGSSDTQTGERPAALRREVVSDVTDVLTNLIEERQQAFGPALGAHAEALAAACVGVAVQVCEHAIDHGRDLRDAHKLAAHFVDSVFRHLDFDAITRHR